MTRQSKALKGSETKATEQHKRNATMFASFTYWNAIWADCTARAQDGRLLKGPVAEDFAAFERRRAQFRAANFNYFAATSTSDRTKH